MKLFQKLLLAPAVIGLLAPITASASEANLKDVSGYSKSDNDISLDTFKPLSTRNPLLAGGEGMNNSQSSSDFDEDSFSSTTTATFTSNFAIGAVNGTAYEKTGATYDYGMVLSTSFTGNDSLDVEFVAGEGGATLPELDLNETGDALKVDSISYTLGLGERTTVFFGDGTPGSALYTSACLYSGDGSDTMSNCGQASSNLDVDAVSTALGASFDLGRGYTAAIGYEGEGGSSDGLMTEEGVDAFGGQIAYTGDSYGFSYTYGNIDNNDGAGALTAAKGVTSYNALNAYYNPSSSNLPSISAGYEWSHDDSAANASDQTTNYFLGVQWDELGNGSLGAAIGTKSPTAENADDLMMYEAFYSYNYADGITITPIVYVKENSGSTEDETGIIVKSAFSF